MLCGRCFVNAIGWLTLLRFGKIDDGFGCDHFTHPTLLKGKKTPSSEEKLPSPHYVLAHYALRQIALSDPLQFLDVVTSSNAGPFLAAIFQSVEERSGQKFPFRSSDLSIHSVRIKNFPSVVIQLPEPQETAEAFMVALVITMAPSPQSAISNQQSVARYFTLEKGFTLTDEARTVLAEWTTDRHSNYGDGPVATVDAFCKAISQHV